MAPDTPVFRGLVENDKLPFFQRCQKTMHGRRRIARSFGNFDQTEAIGFARNNFEQMQRPKKEGIARSRDLSI
jgi:hypothetical protein